MESYDNSNCHTYPSSRDTDLLHGSAAPFLKGATAGPKNFISSPTPLNAIRRKGGNQVVMFHTHYSVAERKQKM